MTDRAALLADLVRIDSVNPDLVPGAAGEAELAGFVAGWLLDAGLEEREVLVHALEDGFNVVGGANFNLSAQLLEAAAGDLQTLLQQLVEAHQPQEGAGLVAQVAAPFGHLVGDFLAQDADFLGGVDAQSDRLSSNVDDLDGGVQVG